MEHLKELKEATEKFSNALTEILERSAKGLPEDSPKKSQFEPFLWYKDQFSNTLVYALEPFDQNSKELNCSGIVEGRFFAAHKMSLNGVKLIAVGDSEDAVNSYSQLFIDAYRRSSGNYDSDLSVTYKKSVGFIEIYSFNEKGQEVSYRIHHNGFLIPIEPSGQKKVSAEKISLPDLASKSINQLYTSDQYRKMLKNEGWEVAHRNSLPKNGSFCLVVGYSATLEQSRMRCIEYRLESKDFDFDNLNGNLPAGSEFVTKIWRYAPTNPFA